MKKGIKNSVEAGMVRVIGRTNRHKKIVHTGEPVPLHLMEKPNGAKAKQWENTGMPSDFWL